MAPAPLPNLPQELPRRHFGLVGTEGGVETTAGRNYSKNHLLTTEYDLILLHSLQFLIVVVQFMAQS
jgi:hypothetical protein